MQGQTRINKSEKSKALFAVGVVSILWGTTWLASKIGVEYIPPLQLSGLRHFIGGGLYVVYFTFFRKMFPQKHQLWQIFWMSILMFVISNAFSVLSVKYMPSGIGSVVGAIMPIWVVLFTGLVFNKVKFKRKTIVGIAMGFAGVVITFFDFIEHIMYTDFSLGILFGVNGQACERHGSLFFAGMADVCQRMLAFCLLLDYRGIRSSYANPYKCMVVYRVSGIDWLCNCIWSICIRTETFAHVTGVCTRLYQSHCCHYPW